MHACSDYELLRKYLVAMLLPAGEARTPDMASTWELARRCVVFGEELATQGVVSED